MPPESPTSVYYVDAIVAILLIIAGGLILIIGIDYVGELGAGPPISVVASAWLIVIWGLAVIIYGIKRLIDDVAKGRGEGYGGISLTRR